MRSLESVSDLVRFIFSPKGFAELCLGLGAFIFLLGVGISLLGPSGIGNLCIGVGIALMVIGIIIYVLEKAGVLGGD